MTRIMPPDGRTSFEEVDNTKSIAGAAASMVGRVLIGLEPVVFLAGGIYVGVCYAGIVGALVRQDFAISI